MADETTRQRAEALLAELRERHKFVDVATPWASDHRNLIESALLRERAEAVEEWRTAVACLLLWTEDADYMVKDMEPTDSEHIERFGQIMRHLTSEHMGDCTRQACTCMRCYSEGLLRQANEYAALLGARPTVEQENTDAP